MLAAGFVLVGGQSRRMGRDKALLPWKSGVLVDDVAAQVSQVTDLVTLLGDPVFYGSLGYPCLPDLHPGLGPLAGIETALTAYLAERNLILACDTPGVSVAHLQTLVDTNAACVITQDQTGRLHPLCAVYHARCLPMVRSALHERRLKLLDIVAQLNPSVIRYPGVLTNINTPEDFASAH